MFVFRVDSSPSLGMGHIMRCTSIANELKALGYQVVFIVSNLFSDATLQRFDIPRMLIIPQDDVLGELPEVTEIISKLNARAIIVDMYKANDTYLEQLQKVSRVFCIDGMMRCNAEITGVINFNPSVNPEEYNKRYSGRKTSLLLGNSFVPLRAEFKDYVANTSENSHTGKRVLLTTGATDNYGITDRLYLLWQESQLYDKYELHIVVGNLFTDPDHYERFAHAHIHKNVQNMRALMIESDFAICQAGTTVFELLSMGVPSIVFAINEIQNTFQSLEPVIKWGGNILSGNGSLSTEHLREIIRLTENHLADPELLGEMRTKALNIFDGKGAERLAAKIIEYSGLSGT